MTVAVPAHGHHHPHPPDPEHSGSGGAPEGGEAPYVDPGPGRAPAEMVVLDIGGDIGALVLRGDVTIIGREVDITPVGTLRSHDLHTMVRRRRWPEGEVAAGVVPEVRAGHWWVWGDRGPIAEVVVVGGAVAEVHVGDLTGSALPH